MGDAPTAQARQGQPPKSTLVPACDRCRSFKKKCSRTFPVCALCTSAGQTCSYTPPSDKAQHRQLKARVEWLSRYINSSLPPGGIGGKRKIDELETGTDLDGLEHATSSSPQKRRPRSSRHGGPSSTPVASGDQQRTAAAAATPSSLRISSLLTSAAVVTPCAQVSPEQQTSFLSQGAPSVINFSPGEVSAASAASNTDEIVNNNGYSPGEGISPGNLAPNSSTRKLVDAYFRHIGRSYPCVDRAKVWASFEAVGDVATIRHHDRNATILYLIMAIGRTTLERAGQLPKDVTTKFDVSYADIVHDCLLYPGFTSIQVLLLLSLYSLFDSGYPSTWSLLCIASRQVVELGLTRRDDRADRDVAERCHRLFWSVYTLDRQMATSLGVPAALVDENMDIPLPSLTIDEFMSNERSQTSLALQISRHTFQLRQLEEKIVKHIHLRKKSVSASLSVDSRRAIIQEIRIEIENWYGSACLLSPTDVDNVPIQNSIVWIPTRYYHLLVLLYYPTHFNLYGGSLVETSELVHFAMKYARSMSALLLQRQLPLNRITLCRLLPVGLIFLHGFSDATSYPAKGDLGILIEILDAFSDGWNHARRAARVLRSFLASITDLNAHVPLQFWVPNDSSSWDTSGKAKQCLSDLLNLMQDCMGRSSSFCWSLAEQLQSQGHGKVGPAGGVLAEASLSENNKFEYGVRGGLDAFGRMDLNLL
ncbi:hypothetical protein MGN70_006249 [Eutypa lata]|nr:hypothetical protein MGN70_006249 [Eutypa lata]